MHYEVQSTSSQDMYNLFKPKCLIVRTSGNPHKSCRSVSLQGALTGPHKTAFNVADLYRQTETEGVPELLNC